MERNDRVVNQDEERREPDTPTRDADDSVRNGPAPATDDPPAGDDTRASER